MNTAQPFTIIRTDSNNPDFNKMIHQLDNTLRVLNGEEAQEFFSNFNVIKDLDTVVLAYAAGEIVGCGCFKKYDEESVEAKRMFVVPEKRGQGIAAAIVTELQKWAAELGNKYMVLETATFLHAAIRLYKRNGFEIIENYGQYIGIEESICMRKQL